MRYRSSMRMRTTTRTARWHISIARTANMRISTGMTPNTAPSAHTVAHFPAIVMADINMGTLIRTMAGMPMERGRSECR